MPADADDMGGDDITRSINLSQLQLQVPEQPPAPAPSEASASGLTVISAPGKVKVYLFPPRPRAAPPPPPPEEDELADTPPPFDGREEHEEHTPITVAAVRAPPPPPEEGESRGLLPGVDAPGAGSEEDGEAPEPPPEPMTQQAASPAGDPAASGGLLGDLPLPEDEEALPAVPAAARVSDSAKSTPASRSRGAKAGAKRSLLGDIPEAAELTPPPRRAPPPRTWTRPPLPRPTRRSCAPSSPRSAENPSFLSRYGLKLAVSVVVLRGARRGVGVYRFRRAQQGGQTLMEVLERTERAISQDTRASLKDALGMLDRALEMDDGNSRAWALAALHARAALRGPRGPGRGAAAGARALDQSGRASRVPGPEPRHRSAGGGRQGAGRRPPRAAGLEGGRLRRAAHARGRAAPGGEEARRRRWSTSSAPWSCPPRNVRALVAIGQYYLDSEDSQNAFKVFTTARELSTEHPLARIGLAESRLALGQELDMALADVQAVGGDAAAARHAAPAAAAASRGGCWRSWASTTRRCRCSRVGRRGRSPLTSSSRWARRAARPANLPKAQQAYEAALAAAQERGGYARAWAGRCWTATA